MRSRSYAPLPEEREYTAFIEELRSVFSRYSADGIVTEPIKTVIYLGSFQFLP